MAYDIYNIHYKISGGIYTIIHTGKARNCWPGELTIKKKKKDNQLKKGPKFPAKRANKEHRHTKTKVIS